MRKLTLLTGALLVLALAVAGGLSGAKPAWAICLCDPNEPYTTTGPNWGKGTSCSAAHTNLSSLTATEANADCGGITKTCMGSVIVTGACHSIGGGMFQEDGYREYKCKVCGPIGP